MGKLDPTIKRVKDGFQITPAREIVEPVTPEPIKITVGGKPINTPHTLTDIETEVLGNLKRVDSLFGSGFKNRYLHHALVWTMDQITLRNVPL
jgi:hypothetical protein